jgi:hypothetical protein
MKKVWIIILIFATSFELNSQKTDQKFRTVKALKSNIVSNAVGVNTHLNYRGTVYDIHYEDIIKPRLVELGTKHIRDHFGNGEVNTRYMELAHNYDIRLMALNNDGGTDIYNVLAEIKRLNRMNPEKPVIDMIEAANERDNGWKKDWVKLCDYMHSLYKIYKADPETSSIPLVGPSFANTRNSAVDLSGTCTDAMNTMDVGNLHAYSGLYPESRQNGGWGISFDEAVANYRKIAGSKPLIESESGFKMSQGMQGHPSVSEKTAAKYSPRLVLNRISRGVNMLYFYQLINNSEDFGLLNNDGTPRLQFISLKNMIKLMADDGNEFAPGELDFYLSGDMKDICQMLFQKSNGNYYLVVWQGINGSIDGTQKNNYTDITNPDRSVTLNLREKAGEINLYRPSFDTQPLGNGTNPVMTLRNKKKVRLSIPDHILVVEMKFK